MHQLKDRDCQSELKTRLNYMLPTGTYFNDKDSG